MILPNEDPFNKRFILLTAFEGFLRKVLLKPPRVILRLPVLRGSPIDFSGCGISLI